MFLLHLPYHIYCDRFQPAVTVVDDFLISSLLFAQ